MYEPLLSNGSFSVDVHRVEMGRDVSTCQRILRAHCGICIRSADRKRLSSSKKKTRAKALVARSSRALSLSPKKMAMPSLLGEMSGAVLKTKSASPSFNLDEVLTKRPMRRVEVIIVKNALFGATPWNSLAVAQRRNVVESNERKNKKPSFIIPVKNQDVVSCGERSLSNCTSSIPWRP